MENNLIGKIRFRDILVNVYHDPYIDDNNNIYNICSWGTRDYTIPIFKDVILEESNKKIESLPQFIVTRYNKIDNEFRINITEYLEREYKLRN